MDKRYFIKNITTHTLALCKISVNHKIPPKTEAKILETYKSYIHIFSDIGCAIIVREWENITIKVWGNIVIKSHEESNIVIYSVFEKQHGED